MAANFASKEVKRTRKRSRVALAKKTFAEYVIVQIYFLLLANPLAVQQMERKEEGDGTGRAA